MVSIGFFRGGQNVARLRADRILWVLVVTALLPSVAGAAPTLISISSRDATVRRVDGATGATLDASVTISLPGHLVDGGTGLARNPITGTLFALLRVAGNTSRLLVTLNENSGSAVLVGDTGDKFSGLAFAADGTLYAVTGDGATDPEALCTLSTIDATSSGCFTLGNGTEGEALAFNPDDGLLYHASGIGTPDVTEIFETVDPQTQGVTNVPLSGHNYEEITSLVFDPTDFFAADIGAALPPDAPNLLRISTGGAVTLVGPLDHVAKGLAFPSAQVPSLGPLGLGTLAGFLVVAGSRALRARQHPKQHRHPGLGQTG